VPTIAVPTALVGNRTASARLLGFSIRTLRNKITEYSADGVDVPPPGGLT
jgi:DNA-binding protein Fis